MDHSDLELAHRLASAAARLALPFWRTRVDSETKQDGTAVSEVDHLVEAAILETLSAERPNDRVLTEESGDHGPPGSRRRWIIDPLDMTEPFLEGESGWGSHVTLECDDEIEIAVITRPVSDDRWWAQRGHGAYKSTGTSPRSRSTRLQVSTCAAIAEADIGGFARPDSATRRALTEQANWTEDRFCVVGAMAEGRLDCFVDDGGKPWDQAPALLIIEEAGGRFFDPEGGRRVDLGWGLYTNKLLSGQLRHIASA